MRESGASLTLPLSLYIYISTALNSAVDSIQISVKSPGTNDQGRMQIDPQHKLERKLPAYAIEV